MSNSFKDKKLVYIKWADSDGVGARWENLDNVLDEQIIIHSVGWLVGDGKNVKVIVPHIQPEYETIGAEFSGCGDMAIPVQSIVEMIVLEVRNE